MAGFAVPDFDFGGASDLDFSLSDVTHGGGGRKGRTKANDRGEKRRQKKKKKEYSQQDMDFYDPDWAASLPF